MYYKIENKDSKVYQELYALRTKELKIEKDNIKAIEEKTGMTWDKSFGNHGQQTFRRVSSYQGFQFKETEKIDAKIWKQHKEHKELYVPNTRTKVGREMQEFLNNGLQGSRYDKVIEILELEELRSFTFPFVEIVDDLIIIFLGDGHEPKDENVIEVTKKEFQSLREKLVIV
jgi:hypothetical protein|nr:MAG TPA: hypothetical protein [Caudoviricetes sp.]